MGETQRVTRELVYAANEFDLPVVPEVHVIRGILGIHPRRYHQNQVALADHLNDFDAAFDAPFDAEAERLQREDREALRCADCKCILVLVEADASDLLIAEHLL